MNEVHADRLYELADLIHGIGRQLRPPTDLDPGICTPIEITAMRFISRHPGTSARTASEACLLPSSNFSRILKGLETKGLVRRESDVRDARSLRLYPTALADQNFHRMREAWSQALDGIIANPAAIDAINATLQEIETGLIARRRQMGASVT